jgi:hypothetical protein
MQVTAADQDNVRNGIQCLEGILRKWYKAEKIDRHELDEANKELKRIDKVCNGNRCEKLDS